MLHNHNSGTTKNFKNLTPAQPHVLDRSPFKNTHKATQTHKQPSSHPTKTTNQNCTNETHLLPLDMLRTSQLLCPKASSAFLHTPCTFTSSIFPCAKRVADTNAVSMLSPLSKGAAAQAWAKPTIAKHTHTHTHRSSPHPLCLSAMSCLEE